MITRVSTPSWSCLSVVGSSRPVVPPLNTQEGPQQRAITYAVNTRLPRHAHTREERKRAGVHPRKSRVVVLLECCGAREELPRPLNAQDGPQQVTIRFFLDFFELTPCTPPPREEEEEGVITRVSRPCWPCLRVVFLTNATRKKSQHTSDFNICTDLRSVRPPLPRSLGETLDRRRERRERVRCTPRK